MGGRDAAQVGVLVVVLALAVVLFFRLRRPSRPSHGPAASQDTPAEGRPWAAVVVNPTKVDDARARAEWLGAAMNAHGWGPPVWSQTTIEDAGLGQTQDALQSGASAVFAYGGDGTVRAVGSALAGTDVPLGLLPAGTGNLLARNLGVPVTDADAALRIALAGGQRRVDIGRAEIDVSGEDHTPQTHTFLVMAGLGFDAEVMAAVHPGLKRRVGWWAYVVAGAQNLRGPQTRVVIRVDDEPGIRRRVRAVVVGNCGELTGGVRLMPDAKVDDGWLDVVAVSPRGLVGWVAVSAAVLSRRRRGHPLVEHLRCRSVEISAAKPLHAQMDGDPVGMARALRVRVQPLALVVLAPGGTSPGSAAPRGQSRRHDETP